MLKHITIALLTTSLFGAAAAQPLPAPPTKAYSPIERPTCEAKSIAIYFPFQEATLTPQALSVLSEIKLALEGCTIAEVALIPEAGDMSDEQEAHGLALARVAAIAAALNEKALEGERISADLTLLAASDPNLSLMGRRIKIDVDAAPREIG